jgi:hypothetical protein
MDNRSIDQGIMVTNLQDDTTILLRFHESTDLGPKANTFFAPLQMCDNGIIIHDMPTIHGGKQCMIIEDIVIPSILQEGMLWIKIQKPPKHEIANCDIYDITSGCRKWEPSTLTESVAMLPEACYV